MSDGSHHGPGTRWGDRLTLRQPVSIEWEQHHREGMIHHLSVSGCFVQVAFPYPVGSTLRLVFPLDPDCAPFATDGKVVTRNLGGIGVRFAYRSDADSKRLRAWIDGRLHAPPSAVAEAA
ncbi:MAG: PilZ domain-containing protein [Nitrospirota bacterium]